MRCPICHCEFEPDESPALPFCSERCRTIDLGRWLDESYGVPALRDPEAEGPAGDAAPAEDQTPPQGS
jgi:endogenous inhibitor of DNA gyrase (YacG/DUF329 family)